MLDQRNISIPSDLEMENRVLRARLETLGFLSSLENNSLPSESAHSQSHQSDVAPDFEFNSSRDTVFSHNNAAFGKVLHIFNAEYYGIRAAAGNLPGGKLAVSVEKKFLPHTLSQIVDQINLHGYEQFVLHGYSKTMDDVAKHIHRVFGRQIYGVWHGNFAQLVYQGEREAFEQWRRLLQEGIVARAHILKQNASDFLECGFTPLLLNLPPRWMGTRIAPAFSNRQGVTAFLPGWIDVRKNWHANMLAAERSDVVHRLFYYADANPVFDSTGKAKRIKFDPITHMDVMSSVDLVLNATLIDCHPMVDLEALACHTPTITSKLFLGDLDLHPYAQLTNIDNVLDTKEIADRIAVVSTVQSDELVGMMDDYSDNLIETSFSRYGEFLNL
jgi:hypothetical protein